MDGRGRMFTDESRLIGKMIIDNWSLGPQNTPNVCYMNDQLYIDGRVGVIQVYVVSHSTRGIGSVDYADVHRSATVSIKVENKFREIHYDWVEEVYRILYTNRRLDPDYLDGYLFIEVTGDHVAPNLLGWYSTTIDVRLTGYHRPVPGSGFGDRLNKGDRD